ncbi:MAG: DUF1698 domain-containing protein [Oscillatoria sp. SIO1A7]|nr:DUF1698 domain-containing protein [Oscillatoria sp. SIO1A7]
MEILDSYVTSTPSAQNALDLFKGEWASKLPDLYKLEAGHISVFNDVRIHWVAERLGITNKTVLELGPLEAGHTYMLEKAGAASIVAVEANARAYLKCLIIKEIMGLQRAQFLFGNFVEYLRTSERFDLCIASGVLYHMTNPVELLSLISQVSDRVFIWTHYYDRDLVEANPHKINRQFPGSIDTEYNGFKHKLYRREYLEALDDAGFCGGSRPFSYWMSREDILACLKNLGYSEIDINLEQPEHPNGPSFALIAIRH